MNYDFICPYCEHYRQNLDKEFCLEKEIELSGEMKECEKFRWVEDLEKISDPKLNIEIRPLTSNPEKLVTVSVPDKPDFIVSVSTWEKIYYIYSKYKIYLDVLIKFTPILLPILKVISWALKLKNTSEVKRNETR